MVDHTMEEHQPTLRFIERKVVHRKIAVADFFGLAILHSNCSFFCRKTKMKKQMIGLQINLIMT